MIRISQIDEKFTIYKEKMVVLFGVGNKTKQMIGLLNYHNVRINCICDDSEVYAGKTLDYISIITAKDLNELVEKSTLPVIVQICENNIGVQLENQLLSTGVKDVICFDEAFNVLGYYMKLDQYKKAPELLQETSDFNYRLFLNGDKISFFNYSLQQVSFDRLLVCLPSKTADHTLVNTFKKNEINYFRTEHFPECFDKRLYANTPNKFKIITAIRDPISRDLSQIYQHVSVPFIYPFITYPYSEEVSEGLMMLRTV